MVVKLMGAPLFTICDSRKRPDTVKITDKKNFGQFFTQQTIFRLTSSERCFKVGLEFSRATPKMSLKFSRATKKEGMSLPSRLFFLLAFSRASV